MEAVQSKSVPFICSPTTQRGGGFESIVAKSGMSPKPARGEQTSPLQKSRATDLFLCGALTEEQLAKAKATRGGFEAIIGRSNLLPAVFLEIGAAVSRATCLIQTSGVDFLGRTGSWGGTGFLLSPNILLTNHHVLNSPQVAAAGSCVFNYQIGIDGQALSTKIFRIRPDRLYLTSPVAEGGLDFTFVWVEGEPGREFGTAKINRQAFAIAEQEFANLISHPGGRMKMISLQENEVQWQDDLVVHYTSDSEPGSSGASVCNNNWQLMALHHASKPSNLQGFQILNEGIKVSAIAAYLEQLAQSNSAAAGTARELLALFGGTDEHLGFFGNLGRRTKRSPTDLEAVVQSYEGTEQDIDVGFWNVEWLTNRYETKVQAVARVIQAMNLDVWSLEESSPNAAEALVKELKDTYDLDFDWLGAEPESQDGKQSCTLLWNRRTVTGRVEPWGEPIESWLRTDSRHFDELGLEAVHGKIFDRYPALFQFTTKQPVNGKPFDFYVVPLHLKAMDEGSLRRQMASKILAAAIRRKIEGGSDTDWIVGGDFNAEIATRDFDALMEDGIVPASANDEQGGAFSYIKGPKSMIDHIFLSPNLSRQFGADDFFVVTADKTFPHYLQGISDHRPVLLRLNLKEAAHGNGGFESTSGSPVPGAIKELKELIKLTPTTETRLAERPGKEDERERFSLEGFERARRRATIGNGADYSNRTGYAADFLGGRDAHVPPPELSSEQMNVAAALNGGRARRNGTERFLLPYTHFSVAINGERRLPFYSAVNIDGRQLRRIPRGGDQWVFDPRIEDAAQAGNDIYSNNDLDRGHMTRRLDPVWGTPSVAALADADTFHFTNACPQHKDLNQREWSDLEDYVLDNANTHDLKVSVFTGPIFSANDKPYRGIRLPQEFWKVVVMVRADTRSLSATGYVLSQKDMLTGFESFSFGRFRTYQVAVREVQRRTGLDFGRLRNFDPLTRARPEAVGLEMAGDAGPVKLVTGASDLLL